MNLRVHGVAVALSLTLLTTTALAEDPAAIRSRTQEFTKTLSAGDAEGVAAFWTPSGEYARGDLTIRGRESIGKAYAEHLKKKPTGKLTIESDTVRFLSEGVAVHEGTFAVERENPADNVRSRFSALYVNVDEKWQFGLLREESVGASLAELAWMVGDWTFKAGDSAATMSFQFSKQKTYLLVKTTVKDGDEEVTATQIIGINPATGGLKSWTFESDGSIGTADWVRTEKGWLANVNGTTAAGEEVRAVTTLTPTSRDAFTFKTTERTVGGEQIPDSGPVKVVRAAAGQ